LVFHIFGALAEFERELIRERTHTGLAAARARGRNGGRPTVMPPDKVATARQMYDSKEYTVEAIARVLGVSRASIYRHLAGPATNAEKPAAGCVASPGRRKPSPRARRRI
jgi:DNA invertase Pin-like site-specific DNA recombinase